MEFLFIKKLLLIVSLGVFVASYLANYNFFYIQLVEKHDVDVNFRWLKSFEVVSGIKKVKGMDNILFLLYIPRIELEENVYTMDSSQNNVDYHVQILNGSDINKNFLFLAGHSGSSSASYFNRLVELEKGDIILIDKGYEKISFVVDKTFLITKNGYLEYSSLENENILYLITCSLEYKDKQLVVKARMVD